MPTPLPKRPRSLRWWHAIVAIALLAGLALGPALYSMLRARTVEERVRLLLDEAARPEDLNWFEACVDWLCGRQKRTSTRDLSSVAEQLAGLGPPAARSLAEALKDPGEPIDGRFAAGHALDDLGGDTATEAFIAVLSTPLPDARLGPQAVAEAEGVRATCAHWLRMMADPRSYDVFLAALTDAQVDVRTEAALALGDLGDTRAVEPLTAALAAAGPLTGVSRTYLGLTPRAACASALGDLMDPRAVMPLISALVDADSDVRRQAALSLGQLGDARAVEPLIAALADESPPVREAAAAALGDLKDTRAVEPLAAALGDADKRLKTVIAEALGALSDPRAIDALVGLLTDADATVRRNATLSLGLLGDPRATGVLIEALTGGSPTTRSAAAVGLGRIGGRRAVEALTRALNDPDYGVRASASKALERLGAPVPESEPRP
jgi:HEAT repeat protein